MACHADPIPSHPNHCDPVIIVASATMVAIVLMAADNCSGGGQVDSIRLHSIPQRFEAPKTTKPRQNGVQYNGTSYIFCHQSGNSSLWAFN